VSQFLPRSARQDSRELDEDAAEAGDQRQSTNTLTTTWRRAMPPLMIVVR